MNHIQAVRTHLLDLHKALLDMERQDYERLNGQVTAAAFLGVLTSDPAFAWLRPMTTLIVTFDDMLDDEASLQKADRIDALERIRAFLAPDENGNEFQRRYSDALQQSPHVLLAHGVLMRLL